MPFTKTAWPSLVGLFEFSSTKQFEIIFYSSKHKNGNERLILDGCRHAPLPSSTSTAILRFV